MESFAHYFEFIAGINSAFILSTSYFSSNKASFYINFPKIIDKYKTALSIWTNNHEQLILYEKKHGKLQGDLGKEIEEEDKIIQSKLSKVKTKIYGDETEGKDINPLSFFNFYAIFSVFYCLIILLLIGFEVFFNETCNENLNLMLLGNLIIVAVILFQCISFDGKVVEGKKHKKFITTDNLTHFSFLWSLAVAIPIIIACKLIPYSDWYFEDRFVLMPDDCYLWVNMTILIIIPSWHFVIFGRRVLANLNRFRVDIEKELNLITHLGEKQAEKNNIAYGLFVTWKAPKKSPGKKTTTGKH